MKILEKNEVVINSGISLNRLLGRNEAATGALAGSLGSESIRLGINAVQLSNGND